MKPSVGAAPPALFVMRPTCRHLQSQMDRTWGQDKSVSGNELLSAKMVIRRVCN
jgi:hypothetical protein